MTLSIIDAATATGSATSWFTVKRVHWGEAPTFDSRSNLVTKKPKSILKTRGGDATATKGGWLVWSKRDEPATVEQQMYRGLQKKNERLHDELSEAWEASDFDKSRIENLVARLAEKDELLKQQALEIEQLKDIVRNLQGNGDEHGDDARDDEAASPVDECENRCACCYAEMPDTLFRMSCCGTRICDGCLDEQKDEDDDECVLTCPDCFVAHASIQAAIGTVEDAQVNTDRDEMMQPSSPTAVDQFPRQCACCFEETDNLLRMKCCDVCICERCLEEQKVDVVDDETPVLTCPDCFAGHASIEAATTDSAESRSDDDEPLGDVAASSSTVDDDTLDSTTDEFFVELLANDILDDPPANELTFDKNSGRFGRTRTVVKTGGIDEADILWRFSRSDIVDVMNFALTLLLGRASAYDVFTADRRRLAQVAARQSPGNWLELIDLPDGELLVFETHLADGDLPTRLG